MILRGSLAGQVKVYKDKNARQQNPLVPNNCKGHFVSAKIRFQPHSK